jgi:hypothetical protein
LVKQSLANKRNVLDRAKLVSFLSFLELKKVSEQSRIGFSIASLLSFFQITLPSFNSLLTIPSQASLQRTFSVYFTLSSFLSSLVSVGLFIWIAAS